MASFVSVPTWPDSDDEANQYECVTAAASSSRSSNAAPIHSFYSLPSSQTLRSSTAASKQAQQQSLMQNVTPAARHGDAYPRLQSRTSGAPSTSRLDQIHKAYKEPAGKSSSGRSLSVGRRSSSDIAARSVASGIASLGARPQPIPQPIRTARAASGVQHAPDTLMSTGSSGGREALDACSPELGQLQSNRQTAGASSSRRVYCEPMSGSTASGRSSLLGRRSSCSFTDETAVAAAQDAFCPGAVAGLPSGTQPGADTLLGRPSLPR